jgi:hypothetical protein
MASAVQSQSSSSDEFNYDNYEHLKYDDSEFEALDPMTQFSVQMSFYLWQR